MARSRNIKPGFFQNDLLAEVHPLGRLLFAALWTLADREGRLEDRVKKIKAQALPYDECDIDALLNDLGSRGFIQRYLVDGSNFIQITKWHKHQQPHIKEAPSTIPAPCESGACPVLASGEPGTSLEQESLIPDSLNLIPDSLSLDSQQNPDQEGTLYGGGVPGTGDTPPPREAPPKKRTPAPLKPKLEAILGPKGSPDEVNYWKLVGIFGAAKNPAPTQTAQAFVDALLKVPVHSILAKAQNLKDTLSGPQYMPQLLKWLDGQGYMNPDASVSSGGPMASVTDEYARYLDGGEVADAS